MKTIIIEEAIYRVTNKQFESIKKTEDMTSDNNEFEIRMSDYFEENKHKFKYIGEVYYQFRL